MAKGYVKRRELQIEPEEQLHSWAEGIQANEGNGKGTAGKGGLRWPVAKAIGRKISQSQMRQSGD